MIKKIILIAFLLFIMLVPEGVRAEENKISVFTSDNCKHCQDLKDWLAENNIQASYYNLKEPANVDLFNQFTNKYGLIKVTPIILVGNKLIEGFDREETTGQQISQILSANPTGMSFTEFMEKYATIDESIKSTGCDVNELCVIEQDNLLHLPWLGSIDPKNYSMPVLTVILGFIDGFNPCAMWVLIMFITIILQAGNRQKMWELVSIFLLAEALMYFMILNVWYKTWNFVQLDQYITPIVGVISLGAAGFFIYEFFTSKDGECLIIDSKTRLSTIGRIKAIATSPLTLGTFLATILLALSINVIEFACSIGIPQAFTKIIEINQYGFLARQFYILLYTLFYMFDDFLVFGIAVYSIDKLGITTKYSRYCQLIGGIIMLVLGYFLIFNPTALKF